ncbi:MAG TPA: hypothetical protein VGY96_12190 [Streptosporangiaceae bacterium]|jgi:hypothetical protein|nr:hypothetical protein [Streptosporangiaceae bacterium]
MINPDAERRSPALDQAARELQAAQHDARVAFDCIALGELDRAHTHALTARVAVDAAVTALMAVLADADADAGSQGQGAR